VLRTAAGVPIPVAVARITAVVAAQVARMVAAEVGAANLIGNLT
jgi:hypothetical protein